MADTHKLRPCYKCIDNIRKKIFEEMKTDNIKKWQNVQIFLKSADHYMFDYFTGNILINGEQSIDHIVPIAILKAQVNYKSIFKNASNEVSFFLHNLLLLTKTNNSSRFNFIYSEYGKIKY